MVDELEHFFGSLRDDRKNRVVIMRRRGTRVLRPAGSQGTKFAAAAIHSAAPPPEPSKGNAA